MIDINELRQSLGAIQTEEVAELLDRLEAAEADALEQARLNGMGASREAALMAKLEVAEKEAAHIKEVEFPRKMRAVAVGWEKKCARLEQERDALRAELETERMRLTACGVVALSNTPDSAKWARDMRPEYWSASCGDVARTVDENIKLRAKVEAMERMEKQEPSREWWDSLIADISAIDCVYRGDPSYAHDAYWLRERVMQMFEQRRDALPGAKGEEK